MERDKQHTSQVFDRWSRWWDSASRYNRKVYDAVVQQLDDSQRRILDVGCGTGVLASMLAARSPGRVVYGLDISPGMVEKAKSLAREYGADRLHFVQGDAEALPFPDAEFDAVVSTLSFHHYPNPLQALREFRRVLRPAGLVVIADVVAPLPVARVYTYLINPLVRRVVGREWAHSRGEMLWLFAEAGFHVIHESGTWWSVIPVGVFAAERFK